VVEIIDAVLAGEIRGMYIMGENPAMSDPDAQHAREALASLEHLVVQDIFLTETAFLADVVLPASAFPEKTGTFTNTNRQVQLARPALPLPGDTRQDWWIIQEIARRIGLDWWAYGHPRDVFAEMRQVMPSIKGITWERLEREGYVTYPCDAEDEPGHEILFGDGFVLGGADDVDVIDFRDSPNPLFLDPPRCLMLKQGSFITNYFATQGAYDPGEESEIGVFTFPTIDGNTGALGGGDTLMVFNPTPENIQIVKDWTSPDWLCTLASPNGGGIAPYGGHGVPGVERLPGDTGVDLGCYDSDTAKIFATAVIDALASNTFVFDGGDLMDPAVGQGTFWTGLVDWSKGKPSQEVVDSIEATWPAE